MSLPSASWLQFTPRLTVHQFTPRSSYPCRSCWGSDIYFRLQQKFKNIFSKALGHKVRRKTCFCQLCMLKKKSNNPSSDIKSLWDNHNLSFKVASDPEMEIWICSKALLCKYFLSYSHFLNCTGKQTACHQNLKHCWLTDFPLCILLTSAALHEGPGSSACTRCTQFHNLTDFQSPLTAGGVTAARNQHKV